MKIDLRSDTFTQPTAAMLAAMFSAKVGDDVFGEDPTVNELEAYCAALFGMEAAIYCPTGTMTNQIAIKCHTQPGDEIICDKTSHVYIYEGGGIAFNSGCQVRAIDGNRGMITAEDVVNAINPDDVHKPITSLVSLENTCNRGGGSCYAIDTLQQIKQVCTQHGLKLHLDGARLFNALEATQQNEQQYGAIFDSISICLSKGLGAPIGSVLLSTAAYIKKARRVRKVMGGGMRQAGYMAAAGLYALKHHKPMLALDHIHAKQIADALLNKDFIGKMMPVETNIIIFEVLDNVGTKAFCDFMQSQNIYCLAVSPTQVRMVTHLDVSSDMVQHVVNTIHQM
ncbi:threonine aldolase family protein [Ferruginibacter yonginensis]|uniref:Threonine aldolase family protein n=1 Tax=Ferruginibacter yonginensis TaxID=1310416 RepID=A0ABV8QMQ4_9BACT